jgi:hypothetical protein
VATSCATVEGDGTRFWLDYERPDSIGKVRPWYGVAPNIVRAYAWIMSLGAEGLREVAEIAVLNNNYLMRRASISGALPRRTRRVIAGSSKSVTPGTSLRARPASTPTRSVSALPISESTTG